MPPLKPNHISPTDEEDAAINAGIALDPDNPELTDEDVARMRPAIEVVPEIVAWYHAEQARKAKGAEAQRAACKTRVTIRLDADLVARLREGGPGWQTRANAALRQAVLGS